MKLNQGYMNGPSKILDRKWREKEHNIHKKKLSEVRSTMREQQGYPYNMPPKNAKREAIQEMRFTEIERENRILLEKMSNIMQKPQNISNVKPNQFTVEMQLKKSLNREARRRHLVKITQENQAILRRLQAKNATYSVERWDKDYHNNSVYRGNVSQQPVYEFGDKFGGSSYGANTKGRKSTSGSIAGMSRIEQIKNGQAMGLDHNWNLPRISTVRQNARTNGQGLGPNNRSSANGGNPLRTVQEQNRGQRILGPGNQINSNRASNVPVGGDKYIQQAANLEANRVVYFKKVKQLAQNNNSYVVEVSSNQQAQNLYIAAYDTNSPESLLIDLPAPKAQEILTQFENDYERMAESLQVMQKRLVLLNPKFIQQQQKRLATAPVDANDEQQQITADEQAVNQSADHAAINQANSAAEQSQIQQQQNSLPHINSQGNESHSNIDESNVQVQQPNQDGVQQQ